MQNMLLAQHAVRVQNTGAHTIGRLTLANYLALCLQQCIEVSDLSRQSCSLTSMQQRLYYSKLRKERASTHVFTASP